MMMNAKRIASCLILWACSVVDSFAPIMSRRPSRCLSPPSSSSSSSGETTFQTATELHLSRRVDVALVSVSVTMLIGYHANLYKKEMSDQVTWRKYQADIRESWARHVRESEGWLYAIQSLRNAITAQTFLASTVLSLLTLITGEKQTPSWHKRFWRAQC